VAKVASSKSKSKTGKAAPRKKRGEKSVLTETETEFETASETETDTGTDSDAGDGAGIREPEMQAKPKAKAKAKTTKKGKAKGKATKVVEDVAVIEEVVMIDESADKVEKAEKSDENETASMDLPMEEDISEPSTETASSSKRGRKAAPEPKKRARKAPLNESTAANKKSTPSKLPDQALNAYVDLIHDSTPVNSILSREMLIEIFEENSEKTLADFLGVLGQKAIKVLDDLMTTDE
jgi:hypothetical protein